MFKEKKKLSDSTMEHKLLEMNSLLIKTKQILKNHSKGTINLFKLFHRNFYRNKDIPNQLSNLKAACAQGNLITVYDSSRPLQIPGSRRSRTKPLP